MVSLHCLLAGRAGLRSVFTNQNRNVGLVRGGPQAPTNHSLAAPGGGPGPSKGLCGPLTQGGAFALRAGDRGWVSAGILRNVAHLGYLIAQKVTACDEKE